MQDLNIDYRENLDGVKITPVLTGIDRVVIQRCIIRCTGVSVGSCLTISSVGPDAVRVQNCILVGNGLSTGLKTTTATSSSSVINFYNNTLYNCSTGINSVVRGKFYNNLFISNIDDVNLTGTASKTDYVACAFGQQPNDGGWTSSIIFGVTHSTEVVSATNSDFNLKSLASSINTGVTISSVVDDFNSSQRPRNQYCIGATEYQQFYVL